MAWHHCPSGVHTRLCLTCKGRALSPGPPAVSVVSIFQENLVSGNQVRSL